MQNTLLTEEHTISTADVFPRMSTEYFSKGKQYPYLTVHIINGTERLSEENPLPKISANGNKSVTVYTCRVIILLNQKKPSAVFNSSFCDFDC